MALLLGLQIRQFTNAAMIIEDLLMKKTFVLDTNVLLHDPTCIFKFDDNDVVIPICCLEELDKFKSESSERGINARTVSRSLDELIKTYGSLENYVFLPMGGRLCIFNQNIEFSFNGIKNSYDNLIIAIAKHLSVDCDLALVSNDINMRVKAASIGVKASEYKNDSVDDNDLIGVPVEIDVDYEQMVALYNDSVSSCDATSMDFGQTPYENMPVIAKCISSGKQSALCFWKNGKIIRFKQRDIVSGISTRGAEQAFLMSLLLNPDIDLVVCAGQAGSGKTVISLAAALDMLRTSKKIDRIMYTKSIVPVGEDIGFVPGTKEEKMAEWVKPMYDNMEFIMKKTGGKASELFEKGLIEVDALTYVRGRSLMNRFIIVDECFPYTQRVMTNKGKMQIGAIFCDYIMGHDMPTAKTFNIATGEFEYKKILSAAHNGVRQLVQVKSGNKKIKCTDNHPFLTIDGYKAAADLQRGDYLLLNGFSMQNSRWLNDDQLQVAMASYLGDGHIDKISNGAYRIKFIHGAKQEGYLKFKARMFGMEDKIKCIQENGYSKTQAYTTSTLSIGLPFDIKNEDCLQYIVNHLDERGLAIWFMDDGSSDVDGKVARLHTEAFSEDENSILCNMLNTRFGIECHVNRYAKKNGKQYFYISTTVNGFKALCALVEKYIHPELEYKILKNNGEKYVWNCQYEGFSVSAVDDVVLTDEFQHVFDIEVEDNHNFIACVGPSSPSNESGFIVHNCQNITSKQVRTIVTRVGEGAKLVLLGDLTQIDSPYLNKTNNGLIHALVNMSDLSNVGVLRMSKTQRSRLAQQAIDRL